jgi:hypothetical protein
MEKWLGLGLPGGVVVLVVVGAFELWRGRGRKRTKATLSATYVNEVTAIFYGTKRAELEYRDSVSLMRADDAQGAPPGFGVDLDRGVVSMLVKPT